MYKYVNKENVKSSEIDFSFCPDYVNQSHRPQLISDMVDEATKTGQLPNMSPLPPLKTYTEDIDSLAPETPGGDKIDGYVKAQQIMDLAEKTEAKLKDKQSALEKAEKEAKDKELSDVIKNTIPPVQNPE